MKSSFFHKHLTARKLEIGTDILINLSICQRNEYLPRLNIVRFVQTHCLL